MVQSKLQTLPTGMETRQWWQGKRFRARFNLWGSSILVAIGAAAMFFPLLWMISTSFKEDGDIFLIRSMLRAQKG